MGKGFDIAGREGIGDDFVKARAAGFTFGFVKLYQAPYGADGGFAKAWPKVLEAGITRAPYIFPDYRPNAATVMVQVNAAWAAFVAAGGWSPGDMAVGVDVEFPGGKLPQSIPGIIAFLEDFVTAVKTVFGCWPIIYTSARVWDGTDTDALRGPTSWVPTKCDLWDKTAYIRAAGQPDPGYVPTGRPKMPVAWTKPNSPGCFINQYGGDVVQEPGFSATIDTNRFLTLGRLNATAEDAGRINSIAAKLGVVTNGVWTDELDAKLRAFQASFGGDADAIIGVITYARLSRMS